MTAVSRTKVSFRMGWFPACDPLFSPNRVRDVGGLNYLPEHLDEQLQFGVNRPPPQHRNGELFGNNPQQIYAQTQQQQNFMRGGAFTTGSFPREPVAHRQSKSAPGDLSTTATAPWLGEPRWAPSARFEPILWKWDPTITEPPERRFTHIQTVSLNSRPIIPTSRAETDWESAVAVEDLRSRLGPGQQQHHLQGLVGHNVLSGLGHSRWFGREERHAQAQQQLLGGLQGVGGYGGQAQLSHAQLQAQLALRQQQQRQQQQHSFSRRGWSHTSLIYNSLGGVHGHNQPAQDLMALLMGNSSIHRE
jgi:hypothetical protein